MRWDHGDRGRARADWVGAGKTVAAWVNRVSLDQVKRGGQPRAVQSARGGALSHRGDGESQSIEAEHAQGTCDLADRTGSARAVARGDQRVSALSTRGRDCHQGTRRGGNGQCNGVNRAADGISQ